MFGMFLDFMWCPAHARNLAPVISHLRASRRSITLEDLKKPPSIMCTQAGHAIKEQQDMPSGHPDPIGRSNCVSVFLKGIKAKMARGRPNWNVRGLVNTGSRLLRGAYREKWRRQNGVAPAPDRSANFTKICSQLTHWLIHLIFMANNIKKMFLIYNSMGLGLVEAQVASEIVRGVGRKIASRDVNTA